MRIYAPKLGRFLSTDPLTPDYPMLTPYQFASNRPIDGIDQDGLEWKPVVGSDGNITDYSWAGFNADGSAGAGTISGGLIEKKGKTYNYGSSGFSINDGSNVLMGVMIFGDIAHFSFSEISESSKIGDTFYGGSLGNPAGARGEQFEFGLNEEWSNYEFLASLSNRPKSGAIESDGLGLFDWLGPKEIALGFGLVTKVGTKTLLSTIGSKAVIKKTIQKSVPALVKTTRRAEFRAIKRELNIPMSEQPKVIKPGTKAGNNLKPRPLMKGVNRRVYDFKNGKRIREDLPAKYPQGGKGDQKQHFNYGNQDEKLPLHSNQFDN